VPQKLKMKNKKSTILEHILSRIIVSESGCWNWTRYLDENGYGVSCWHGKKTYAHRLSWRSIHGDITSEDKICHRCDNPSCVNPDHLFVGTQHDNILDCLKKGRNRTYKISIEDRERIKSSRRSGATLKEIADKFGVSIPAIWYHTSVNPNHKGRRAKSVRLLPKAN